MRRMGILGAACAGLAVMAATASADPVNQVAPGTLTGTAVITFDDVAGGSAPGTNYNGIFESGGAAFAERFVGQTRSGATFDTLSGTPSGGSLTLQVGDTNDNLNVFTNGPSQVLTGLGPRGFPSFDAIGEGSFAVLFDFDQSEFGFDLVGGNSGTATVQFWNRTGGLIDTIVLAGLGSQSYGFRREGGLNDIAGISIYNSDGGGIGFDNLIHDVAGVPGTPGGDPVPEPGTIVLVAGALGFVALRRRKKQA